MAREALRSELTDIDADAAAYLAALDVAGLEALAALAGGAADDADTAETLAASETARADTAEASLATETAARAAAETDRDRWRVRMAQESVRPTGPVPSVVRRVRVR